MVFGYFYYIGMTSILRTCATLLILLSIREDDNMNTYFIRYEFIN